MALTPQQRRRQRFNQLLFMQMSMAAYASTKASWTPLELFRANEPGGWWDPSDFSTMFQDSAGTTPVTAVEQPVGLIRDKSGRGNHRTQSTSAARPTLSARYNLLDNTAFSGAATGTPGTAPTSWGRPVASGTQDSVTDDGAGNNILAFSVSANRHFVSQTTPTLSANTVYDCYVTLHANSGLDLSQLCIPSALPAGATYEHRINGATALSTDVPVAGSRIGWRLTIAGTAGTAIVRIGLGCTGAVTGSASFSKPDIRPSNDGVGLPAYQRVNTSTDYDTSGFPMYLKYDGTDDFMQTAAVDFSGTDAVSIFAGARKLSDAAQGALIELTASVAANNGGFLLAAPDGASATFAFDSKGTAQVDAVASSQTAPLTAVLSGLADISSDSCLIRVNGTQADSDAGDQGTGNYSNAALYFGARAGSSLFFNGREYQTIIRGAASTATEIAAAELYVNNRTKAY